jgi:hypothetical protein
MTQDHKYEHRFAKERSEYLFYITALEVKTFRMLNSFTSLAIIH